MEKCYKKILTPVFGYDFLQIAKSYTNQKNVKEKLYQSIKIIIFSVAGAEAFANLEAREYFNSTELNNFIYCRGSNFKKPKNKTQIYKKWSILLEKSSVNISKRENLLERLERVVQKRNEIIHFKPHENQIVIEPVPKKRKKVGFDGKLYTTFCKTGYKQTKNGILTQLTLKECRESFKKIYELIYEYYLAKKSWPMSPKFLNSYYGSKSPFFKNYQNIAKNL